MRPNPALNIEQAILELSVGEALVSLLDAKGTPGVTERAWMLAPGSRIGPLAPAERQAVMAQSVVAGVYERQVDRESAFEMLKARAEAAPGPATPRGGAASGETSGGGARGGATTSRGGAAAGAGIAGALGGLLFGTVGPRGGKRDGLVDIMAKSAARSTGTAISRSIVRGVLGSLLGGGRRR
jgi:hypothetical protein